MRSGARRFLTQLLSGILLGLPSWLVAAAVQETAIPGDRTLLERFRYVREAVRDEYGGEIPTCYAIAVDGAFFETVRSPQELGIQRPDGAWEPFLLRKLTHTAVHTQDELLPGRISLVQSLPDGRRAIDVESSGETDTISGVELELADPTAGGTLEILLGDGRQWEQALPECRLAGVSASEFGSVRSFAFAHPGRGRLVRLIFGGAWVQASASQLPVTAVRFRKTLWSEIPDVPLLTPGTLELLGKREENGRTVLEFHSDWTPVKEFSVDSDTPDFQRRVTIAGSDDRRHWTEIAGGTIRRIGPERSLTVEMPESRWKFYRVEILNGKFRPLQTPRIRTGKVQYEILLNAAAPEHLTIYYGTPEPPPPAEGSVTLPLPGRPVGSYRLSAPELNPLRRYGVIDAGNYRFFAGCVILCGALLAVLYALRAVTRSEETLPRD